MSSSSLYGNMDVFGVFSEYINPFACPVNVFEEVVLGKIFTTISPIQYLLIVSLQTIIGFAVHIGSATIT